MNFTKIHITILTSILLIVSSCSRSQKALYTSNTENAKRFGLGTSPLQPIAPKPIAQVEEETNAVITPALAQEKSPITADNTTNSIITIPSAKKFSGISSLHSRKKQLPQGNCDDIIVFKSGEEVKCKLVEIGTKEIKYKRCDNLDGPDIFVSRNKVFMLKYANGTKEVISKQTEDRNNITVEESGEPKYDGLAIASLVLGIFGFIPVCGILAVIFGAVSLSRIIRNPMKYKGKGFAIAGLFLGVFFLVATLVFYAQII